MLDDFRRVITLFVMLNACTVYRYHVEVTFNSPEVSFREGAFVDHNRTSGSFEAQPTNGRLSEKAARFALFEGNLRRMGEPSERHPPGRPR